MRAPVVRGSTPRGDESRSTSLVAVSLGNSQSISSERQYMDVFRYSCRASLQASRAASYYA